MNELYIRTYIDEDIFIGIHFYRELVCGVN